MRDHAPPWATTSWGKAVNPGGRCGQPGDDPGDALGTGCGEQNRTAVPIVESCRRLASTDGPAPRGREVLSAQWHLRRCEWSPHHGSIATNAQPLARSRSLRPPGCPARAGRSNAPAAARDARGGPGRGTGAGVHRGREHGSDAAVAGRGLHGRQHGRGGGAMPADTDADPCADSEAIAVADTCRHAEPSPVGDPTTQ